MPLTVSVNVPAVQVMVLVPAEYVPVAVPDSVIVPAPVNDSLYVVANVVTD